MLVSRHRFVPERGYEAWITLNPQAGHEQAGRRPAVVLSPAAYNKKVGLALLCPITSQVKDYPFKAMVPPGLKVQEAVLSDHVKCLDWRARNVTFICKLPASFVPGVLAELNTLLEV